MASVYAEMPYIFCVLLHSGLDETLFGCKECIFKLTLMVMDGSNFRNPFQNWIPKCINLNLASVRSRCTNWQYFLDQKQTEFKEFTIWSSPAESIDHLKCFYVYIRGIQYDIWIMNNSSIFSLCQLRLININFLLNSRSMNRRAAAKWIKI